MPKVKSLDESEIDEILETNYGKKLLDNTKHENGIRDFLRNIDIPFVKEFAITWRKEKKRELAKKKNKTVTKPRTLHDSEINNRSYFYSIVEQNKDLFKGNEKEIRDFLNVCNLCVLSNSYGFLTDAIFRYLRDYREGKTNCVTISKYTPYAGNLNLLLDDVIVIKDDFSNFCEMAGITDHNQRHILIKEIRENRFETIGLSNINLKKNKVSYSIKGFLSYCFVLKSGEQVKNLQNVTSLDFIDKVILQFNKEIFESVLTKGRTDTRGYYILPENLERELRHTVAKHKEGLINLCKDNEYKYIKGGDYTNTIRPMFNLLVREIGIPVQKEDDLIYQINKPIKTYARQARLFGAFFIDKKGKEQFKKGYVIEHMSYALEVLKLLYQDGIKSLYIVNYSFINDNIVIELKKNNKEKKKLI